MKQWLINMYGVYAAFVTTICVLVTGVIVLLMPGLRRRRRIAHCGLRITFFCAGIPFSTSGLELLTEGPCIAIANHRSYLDGLVLIAALPPTFTPVIKEEISHVPVISRVLRRVGARYVRREPAMTAGRDTKRLLDALRESESLAIFPEGTFSVDAGLLSFCGGAFFLAAKAQVPVVPVTIEGSRNVLPVGRVLPRPAAVKVSILAAQRADRTGHDAAHALRDCTEQSMWHGLRPQSAQRPGGSAVAYDYYRRVFQNRCLPQAYLDLDVLERNIRTVLSASGGKRLRIDARALRCPTVIDRVLRSNIRFQGVECSSGFEAVYLAREWQLADVLVAQPTLCRNKIAYVCAAIASGCDITLTVDAPSHVAHLSRAARAAGIALPVCDAVDLSSVRVSQGSTVRTVDALLELLDVIGDDDSLRFRGILTFACERSTLSREQRWLSRRLDANSQRRLSQRRRDVIDRVEACGYSVDLFSGGAGSVVFNVADSSVSEIAIGSELVVSGFGHDDAEQETAIGLAMTITRRPVNDVYVCFSGGYNVAHMIVSDALPRSVLPSGAIVEQPANAGTTNVPIGYSGELRLGDPVFVRLGVAGELCERFSRLLLIQGGDDVESAPTYRALDARLHRDAVQDK